MHTVLEVLTFDKTIEYQVVHTETKHHVIARFDPSTDTEDNTAINNAAHLCNRLNGGMSSEVAALVLHLTPLLKFAAEQMQKERL